jgi:hypothetical protein
LRINKIIDLIPRLENSNYRIILVQIQEAHSKFWPLGMDNHPDIQHTLEDRITRFNTFINEFNIDCNVNKSSIRVLIDPWGDIFENTYQAWPDQYYIISAMTNNDDGMKILKKSTYTIDAKIEEDYSEYLDNILQ